VTGVCPVRKVPYSKGMSPGLAARTLFVCVVVLGGGISHADRRPVAVVDLSGAPEAAQLAKAIRAELNNHPDLEPVVDTLDETALVEPLADEDRAALTDAARAHHDAEVQRAQFKHASAISLARTGQERLLVVSPPATVALYAELTLTLGMALFSDGDPAAAGAFALVHRLAPGRKLDPAIELPDLVDAFEAARSLPGNGEIEITGTGVVYVDGVELGAAPRVVPAGVGLHYVQLAGPERETRGMPVVVTAGAKVLAEPGEAPASRGLQVRRARAVLAQANEPLSRASAMQHVAKLVDVADAVLILGTSEQLQVQTWRAQAGFTGVKDVGKQKPLDLLTPIEPPHPKKIEKPIPVPIPEGPRWYEDRRVQVGTAAGVVVVVLTAILWARSNVNYMKPAAPITFPQ